MNTQFIKIEFDLFCQWTKLPPSYRIYVGIEMVTERTWRFQPTQYVREILPLRVMPGDYIIRIENLAPEDAEFKYRNLCCTAGTAFIENSYTFRVPG
jgi:hypothetical protein